MRTPFNNILPFGVQRDLMQAAAVDPHLPPGESISRTLELDHAIARARLRYPKHFTPEPLPRTHWRAK